MQYDLNNAVLMQFCTLRKRSAFARNWWMLDLLVANEKQNN